MSRFEEINDARNTAWNRGFCYGVTDCLIEISETLAMMYDKMNEKKTTAENTGEWILDKSIYNWRCSRCGQTPPPTGYVGKADFMATHFKFCSHCGADMRGEQNDKRRSNTNT